MLSLLRTRILLLVPCPKSGVHFKALANLAIERGVKTKWHPLYGGHCAVDIASLAAFLASS
jgi:hypothetical protein